VTAFPLFTVQRIDCNNLYYFQKIKFLVLQETAKNAIINPKQEVVRHICCTHTTVAISHKKA
jgi:hypothetical protein